MQLREWRLWMELLGAAPADAAGSICRTSLCVHGDMAESTPHCSAIGVLLVVVCLHAYPVWEESLEKRLLYAASSVINMVVFEGQKV